jgi:hypothetical protein
LEFKKKVIIFSTIIILIVGSVGAHLFRDSTFIHSTPERLIRCDLVFNGHPISAFTTYVYKSKIDSQYGQMYSCKNPSIGPDYYSFIEKNGLWYINWHGTGAS